MGRVDADPQSLRELRAAIQRGQTEIDRAVAGMRGALRSANWNDDRRRQFERDLEKVLGAISGFSREAEELKAYLSRKADDLDRFLQR